MRAIERRPRRSRTRRGARASMFLTASTRVRDFTRSCAPAPQGAPFRSTSRCWALPLYKADGVFHRFNVTWVQTHALAEPHAPSRHAGDFKNPRGRCALCSTSCAGTRQQCKTSRLTANNCCATPACTSRSSTQSMDIRSSSSWWQPSWPRFRFLRVNPKP